MRMCCGVVVVAGFLVASPASAQTSRRVGLTVGYPTQVGLLWHINDRVAIAPDVGFSTGTSETQSETTITILPGGTFTRTAISTSDSFAVTAGLSLILTLKTWDSVALYLAPAYGYSRNTATLRTTINLGFGSTPETRITEADGHGHSGAASIGAQLTPHERFAIFAETGLRYSVTRVDFSKGHSLGTAGLVAAVIYF